MVMGRCSPRILSEFLLEQQRLEGSMFVWKPKIADLQTDGEEVVITLEGGEELRADAVVYGMVSCQMHNWL